MAVRIMREQTVTTNSSPNSISSMSTNPSSMNIKKIELSAASSKDSNKYSINVPSTIHESTVDIITECDSNSSLTEYDRGSNTNDIIEEEEDDETQRIIDIEEEEEDDEEYDDIDIDEGNEVQTGTNIVPLIWDDTKKIWEYYWTSDGINNVHIGFSCKEMYQRNELYFKSAEEAVMYKRIEDKTWLSSAEYPVIQELIKYNDVDPTQIKTNPFNYHRVDGDKTADMIAEKISDLEWACCTPMCACCTMCGFFVTFIMELIISTTFEEEVPPGDTAKLGFWTFDGYFFHFLTIFYAVMITITGLFITVYCWKKLWLQWRGKPKYFCYFIAFLFSLYLLSAAIIDGAYENEHDADIGFVAVFLLIMIFTFCGPICLCCFVLSG